MLADFINGSLPFTCIRLIDSFSLSTSTVCVRACTIYVAVIAPAAAAAGTGTVGDSAVVIVFLFGLLRA